MSNEQEKLNAATDPTTVNALVEGHRSFLRFLEKRVESIVVAEEILQSAFVKALEKGSELRDGESTIAWFYRLLRNAVVDHYRRRDIERRGLAREASEVAAFSPNMDAEVKNAICSCMGKLLPSLKPEYADVLRKIDLEEKPLAGFAAAEGISTNNATVRLHRARQALKRQLERSCGTCATHGCLDCTCGGGKMY